MNCESDESSEACSPDETEYEVEYVLSKRVRNRCLQYKIKWKDYSITEL